MCCGGHDPAGALGRTCDGVPGVITAVRDEIRKGAKFIKVMVGFLRTYVYQSTDEISSAEEV